MSSPALWLSAGAGPDPDDLARRAAWWARQAQAFSADGGPPVVLDVGALGPALDEGAHARSEDAFEIAMARREAFTLLRAWFGEALDALGVDLGAGELGRVKSWLDARWRLRTVRACGHPGELVKRLGDVEFAQALLFEQFAPPAHGGGLGRYPKRLTAIAAALSERERVRVWDAGCGTGEGTWEIALALAKRGLAVEAVGSTPFPLEQLMAERRDRPHDGASAARWRDVLSGRDSAASVRFDVSDVLDEDTARGPFDLVVCHGVLGESLAGEDTIRQALGSLTSALAPRGVLSVTDRFREDVSRRAAELTSAVLSGRHGLVCAADGLWRRE